MPSLNLETGPLLRLAMTLQVFTPLPTKPPILFTAVPRLPTLALELQATMLALSK